MSPLLFDLVIEVLAIMVRHNPKIAGVIDSTEVKISLFTGDIVLFLQSPEQSLK